MAKQIKNKPKKIVIIIILILILGLSGYLVYDAFFNKAEVKLETKTETKKEETKENLDAVAESLVTTIKDDNIWRIVAAKNYIASISFDNKSIDEDIIIAAIHTVGNCINDRSCSSLPITTLDNYFKTSFGITDIDYKTIKCPVDETPIYKYDSAIKEYTFTGDHPHDGLAKGSSPIYTKINNIEKDKDNYVLTTTEIYNNMRDNEFISADQNGTVKVADYQDYFDNEGNFNTNKLISDYENSFERKKNNYPKYKYTFKKGKDDYYLIKYEVIK